MYNLGNLLTDQWMNAATRKSALITLDFPQAKLSSISILPIYMDREQRILANVEATGVKLIQEGLAHEKLYGIESKIRSSDEMTLVSSIIPKDKSRIHWN